MKVKSTTIITIFKIFQNKDHLLKSCCNFKDSRDQGFEDSSEKNSFQLSVFSLKTKDKQRKTYENT
jgi:hypothetical protein